MPRIAKKTDKPTGTKPGAKISEDTWDMFFAAVTKYAGNVSRACELQKITRTTVYDHRDADPVFAARLEQAKQRGIDVMEDEATRRAVEGVDENVLYKGDVVDVKTTYSDTLVQFLLKGNRPEKYRERVTTENFNMNSESEAFTRKFAKLSDADIDAELKKRMK